MLEKKVHRLRLHLSKGVNLCVNKQFIADGHQETTRLAGESRKCCQRDVAGNQKSRKGIEINSAGVFHGARWFRRRKMNEFADFAVPTWVKFRALKILGFSAVIMHDNYICTNIGDFRDIKPTVR